MPEELAKCPVLWCTPSGHPNSILILEASRHGFRGHCCDCGLSTPYFSTREEAIAAWNSRPVSEIERLAREVAMTYTGMAANGMEQTHTVFDVLEACKKLAAAHLAET